MLSAERLPCRTGLCPPNRSELTGWGNLPLASPLTPRASANIPYALPAAPPTMFCPLSPEAYSADSGKKSVSKVILKSVIDSKSNKFLKSA
jgi:hypothetical protein